MTSPRRSQRSVESIDHEHRMLRRLVGRLGDLLTDGSSMPATLPTLIGSLVAQLEIHFKHEEAEGYFSGVVDRVPQLTANVEMLKQQHADFRRTIRRLYELANRQETGPGEWERLKAGCEDFVGQLLAHEAAENALLQEAYAQDIGEQD